MKGKCPVDSYGFWSAAGFYSMNMGYLFLDYDPSVEIKIPVKELLWYLLVFHETKINALLKRLGATWY